MFFKNIKPKVVIKYSKDGKAIGDFEVESFVEDVIANIGKGKDYIVSSSIAINALRLAIVEGRINKDCVKFLFYGKCGLEEVKVTKYGSIENCPRGFCDKDIDICESILINAIKMKKKEK